MSDIQTMSNNCVAFARQHLKECCAELIEWQDTAVLRKGKVRELANIAQGFIADHDALKAAEAIINRVALELATAAPTDAKPDALTPLDYRAQGREEALAAILDLEAEEGMDAYITSSALGDSGDYTSHWDEEKLRELLHIGDHKHDAYDRAEAAYWDSLGHKEEADEREMRLVERAPFYKPLSEFLATHKAWDLMGELKRAADESTAAQSVRDAAQPTIAAADVRDAERYNYVLDCEVIAASKYLKPLDAAEFKAKIRARHDRAIASATTTPKD